MTGADLDQAACCRLPLFGILVKRARAFAETAWNVRVVGLLLNQLSFINLHRAHEYTRDWKPVHMLEVCTVAHLMTRDRSITRRKEHRPCNDSIAAEPRTCAQRPLCRHPEHGARTGRYRKLQELAGRTWPVTFVTRSNAKAFGQSKLYKIR